VENADALAVTSGKYKNLVTIREAARIIPFSEKTLRNWRAEKKFSRIFVKLFGKVFIDLAEVDVMIKTDKERTVSEVKRLGLDD
jgi:hypothetical protein